MKKRFLVGIFLSMFTCISCEKWLNVKPELDIYETTMFESAQGYYIALNGLYVDMATPTLYGQELTWGAMEAWGHSYTIDENYLRPYFQIMNYQYDKSEAKELAEAIWLTSFRVIAEANNLINNLSKDDKVVFTGEEITKNMILGEALAIRAMLHFDLVRIFAQAPIVDNGSSTTVPYVTTYPSKVNPPIPTKEVLQQIMTDLDSAKILLRPFDGVTTGAGYISSFKGNTVNYRLKLTGSTGGEAEDDFFKFRCNRMNYYAVTQLLARIALYAGNMPKAEENAYEIIAAVDKKVPWTFVDPACIGDPAALSIVEPRLHSEIVFGTYYSKLKEFTEIFFGDNSRTKLYIEDKLGIYGTNLEDVRLRAIPENIHTKYTLNGKVKDQILAAQDIIPLMRIPECFFIYAESCFDRNQSEAIRIYNKFTEARGNKSLSLSSDVTKEIFMENLIQEYRREYLSEGQIVFLYKRLNIPLRTSQGDIINNGNLVMPVPDSEAGI